MLRPIQLEPDPVFAGARALDAGGGSVMRAAWLDVLMLHFVVPVKPLQAVTPFSLDLFAGWGVVTLVAFRLSNLRLVRWPWLPRWATAPGEHEFLNVRTYVKPVAETGIHFLREFVPKRLARMVGPLLYGLPYRLARIGYRHDPRTRRFQGLIGDAVEFDAEYAAAPDRTIAETFDEFVLERYTAFHRRGKTALRFRVAHPCWEMHRARLLAFRAPGLLRDFAFWRDAQLVGGHFTPGFEQVDMGPPRKTLITNGGN